MRLVMMGTGPFAVPTFQALLESSHDVPALVTRPTRTGPGGRKAPPSPMRALAESRAVPVFDPESANSGEAHELLRDLRPELLVVCDYGQILSTETLGLAPRGGINLHASLLPRYRGAAPVNWALLEGASETGVTVIHMTPKLDAGPALVQRATAVGPHEDAVELEARLARLGVEPVLEAITMLESWDGQSPLGRRQDREQATRAPRLHKQQGAVDWSRSAEQLFNQVRALKPWPGTFTYWLRESGPPLRLILDQVAVVPSHESAGGAAEPGTVVAGEAGRLEVATGGGRIELLAVQPAGKRVMAAEEFLRGHALKPGERLGAPQDE